MRKAGFYFALIGFISLGGQLLGMPEIREVASGAADPILNNNTLQLIVSEKAIVNYKTFNINVNEAVQFIQPSASSCVLNRVVGSDPSSILGSLSANGKVFLVNPNGVYFGPNAAVNTGSLLVSTLDIADDDFSAGRFQFSLAKGTEKAKIINQGTLQASPEGTIAFLAPIIRNEGTIIADAGRVALISGEKVTIDFAGDGMLSFSVEGALEEALIEHLGSIHAEQGQVQLHMKAADAVIQRVLNTDGVVEGVKILKENGVVRIAANSELYAKNIAIEGPGVEVDGVVSASDRTPGALGGTIHLLGDSVVVRDALVEASGDFGGGTVLIGGDYQGKGSVRNSDHVYLNQGAVVEANAYTNGNGGKIIVWGDQKHRFEGKLLARGGSDSGNGGFVETSCDGPMIVTGNVDTTGPHGDYGHWMIDPVAIVVVSGGGGSLVNAADCTSATASLSVDPVTIAAATTTVDLCAKKGPNSNITVTDAITGMPANIGITFSVGGSGTPTITLNNNISTSSGFIAFSGADVTLGGSFTGLNTKVAGDGASVAFSGAINGGGTTPMTVTTGAGSFRVDGTIGATTSLTALTVTANGGITLGGIGGASPGVTGTTALTSIAGINLNGGITYNTGGEQTYTGSVTIGDNTTITTSADAVRITGSVDGDIAGRTLTITTAGGNIEIDGSIGSTVVLGGLTLNAGAGIITVGTIGTNLVAGSTGGLTFTSTASPTGIILNGSGITTSGAAGQTYAGHVKAASTLLFTSTNAPISFQQTLNGSSSNTESLGFASGSGIGSVTFTGAVGNLVPLDRIDIFSANGVTVTETLTASSFTENAATGVNVLRAITTSGTQGIFLSGTTFTFNGALTTTNSGNIRITNTGAMTLPAAATVSSNGDFIQKGGGAVSLGANITTSNSLMEFTNAVTLSGAVVLNSGTSFGDIIFDSSLDGGFSLSATSGLGQIQVVGPIGVSTPMMTVSLSASAGISLGSVGTAGVAGAGAMTLSTDGYISLNGSIYNATSHTYSGGLKLQNNVTIQSASNNNVSITGTIDGDNVSTRNLSINTGGALSTGGIIITSAIGTQYALGVLSLDAKAGTLAIGNVGAGTIPGAISGMTLAGSGGILLNGGIYTTSGGTQLYSNNVTLGATTIIYSTNSAVTFSGKVNGLSAGGQPLAMTLGSGALTFTGAVGDTLRVGAITINSASSVTASAAITANSFREQSSTGANSFQGLNTTATAGIVLNSSTVALNSTVTATSGGPLNINNTGLLTISGAIDLDGSFLQSGGGPVSLGANITTTKYQIEFANSVALTAPITLNAGSSVADIVFEGIVNGPFALTCLTATGVVQINQPIGALNPLTSFRASGGAIYQNSSVNTTGALSYTGVILLGGNITTANNNITISGDIIRNVVNDVTLSSTGGNITINGMINADAAGRNLTLTAGAGSVSIAGVIGGGTPLNNFTASCSALTMEGIGGLNVGVSNALTLTSTGAVTYLGTNYSANNQTHTAATFFNLNSGSGTLFSSMSGNVTFVTGTIQLANGSDFLVTTTNGNLTFPNLRGTSLENVFVSLGSGTANLGSIGLAGSNEIQDVYVTGGTIYLNGAIYSRSMSFNSLGNILNAAGSVNTIGSIYSVFNALGGKVGTENSPIQVGNPSFVLVGASTTGDFTGTTADNTLHCLPSNPATQLHFNGIIIACTSTPIPISSVPLRDFYVPGIYSSDYNLSNNFYFMGDLIAESYMQNGSAPMYYVSDSPMKKSSKPKKKTAQPELPAEEPEFVQNTSVSFN